MLRVHWFYVALITVVLSSVARASDPAVVGNLQGLELAQQTDFNPAVFVGVYGGTVGGKFAFGTWAAGVQHETPLPEEAGQSIAITSGQWQMQIWVFQGLRLKRVVLSGDITGTLAFSQTDQFSIDAVMNVTSGGSGSILLGAILDHTTFPPRVSGTLSQ